jgi:endonuclease III
MKNASKYAEILKGLMKSFQKDGKAAPPEKQDPLKAMVRGVFSYDVPDNKGDEAVKIIEREFVNLNELRVATPLEVQDMLGNKYPAIEHRVGMITLSLNAIFEKEHTLSLDRLKTVSKKDARQFLRELPEMHPFVEAYVMLFGFEAPTVPIDEESLAYLREQGMFEEKTTIEDAQRFLEAQIKVEECYEFYHGLRRAVFGRKKR